ncbi:patatin-like protein [Sphingobium lignivorans]|uniref:Patatin-related protein n=1 Tax=Sphingobium lignivorans TaxID=2735886 RepID=A0ABR6NEV8_9SPHN|nr:patatin-like protein [Sphingobium lignivorans]MBB5985813.1 patatin-related protein [Sphingobium lignivorans]
MREKELRLALVCYGGVSLAVYMHGVTKEIWRLARASRDFWSAGPASDGGSESIYLAMLRACQADHDLRLRVLPDIIAGASAGGINGIFLAQAIETGESLDPLTELWLRCADADILLDPDARPLSRFTKFWAAPILWLLMRRRGDTVDKTVAPEAREEVRRKLSNFVRARWFAPPFGGKGFSGLLLDAFDAMSAGAHGEPLLPPHHPLDLFVTATDFAGHEETLRLNSPPQIKETEHRLTIAFRARGDYPRRLADPAELVFAARATASFPGAFPPFTVRELDRVLSERERPWPGRQAFLRRILPHHSARGTAEDAVLIDGSVLANAPFAQAIDALKDRPARRIVDRRFVYVEPAPDVAGFRLTSPVARTETGERPLPGFFRTIFGAVSDIPREQPIRDNLEAIAARSARIRRMQHIVDALRPDIERTVDRTLGRTLFLIRPTARRLAVWRARFQQRAARSAGFAYPAYGYLKYSGIVEELADLILALAGEGSPLDREELRRTLRDALHVRGIDNVGHGTSDGASDALIAFYRSHDVAFRIRRLRFLARNLSTAGEQDSPGEAVDDGRAQMRDMLYEAIALYAERQLPGWFDETVRERARAARRDPLAAIEAVAEARDLREADAMVDARFAEAAMCLAPEDRRHLLKAYLGFPFYDIATLPLLQGEGLDEYDPIKVDRISPEDATAIRAGGAAATLRGIEFNSFGAFFSRAYRENDYLWGRLHGADRLIDLLLSTMPAWPDADARRAAWKRQAFEAILDEEEAQLPLMQAEIARIRQEIDAAMPAANRPSPE